MAFLNGKKRSRLFAVTLLIVSMVTAFSLPFSVYATEDNPREPTTTEGTLIDNPGLAPTENPPAEPPIAPPTEDPSTDKPVLEPVENPEQEVPAASELTIYVVEYETADGEKLLQDKVVEDQMVGDEVSEDAIVIEGYSVDESSKSITLAQDENLITFVYKTAELADEELPPVEEELPPVEEELPPVVEIPVIEEEVVTEPAIVVEPTAATLTITHRLIVGDEYAEEIRVIDGLEVGQTLDLTEYLAPIDWVECITQEKSITLELAENTVVLEYVVSEGADVSVVLEDGNAVLEQDTTAEIKTDDEYANGIAQ
jgi:hypothetical protein